MNVFAGGLALLLFFLFPICLVLFNKRYSPRHKLVGVIASLFFSWFGFIAFYVLVALGEKTAPTKP
jgi:hypothetical protein